jgi:ATP-dependent RNA helicase DDX23/PRP28
MTTPKFLTKAEREAAALARLAAKVRDERSIPIHTHYFFNNSPAPRAQRQEQEAMRANNEKQRADFRQRAKEEFNHLQNESAHSTRQPTHAQPHTVNVPAATTSNHTNNNYNTNTSSNKSVDVLESGEFVRTTSKSSRELEREQALFREQYLGVKEVQATVKKHTERARFNFSWKNEDDTSRDVNPLYQDRLQLRPLFGRGFVAGVDHKAQVMQHRELIEQQRIEGQRVDRHRSERERELERAQLEKLRSAEQQLNANAMPSKHWSVKSLAEMDERDWRIFREDHQIATKGGSIPKPLRGWDEANLPAPLRAAIDKLGYKTPSAIQMQALPIALAGRDVLGIAETGSGKTAAFLLPMMTLILQLPPITAANAADGPYAIVMAPTRELAQQIEEEVHKLASETQIKCVSVVGGQSIDVQTLQLTRGVEIVIATPGRLVECLESHILVLNQCNYVVLDEADRMIDMNFEEAINKILDAMPATQWKSQDEAIAQEQERVTRNASLTANPTDAGANLRAQISFRTTNLFSATMPPAVERLARKYLRRPATIYIGERGQAVDRIHQVIRWCGSESGKKQALLQLLDGAEPPIIVFVNTKKGVDAVARGLEKLGWTCAVLHSGRTQDQREHAISQFKAGRYQILVATDVAGRGIDVQGVTHVINYDLPSGPTAIELYTHRIGRTGRAGRQGLATSLVTADDAEVFYELNQFLSKSHNKTLAEEFAQHESTLYPPDPNRKRGGPAKPLKD